jgi:hypothetical protein
MKSHPNRAFIHRQLSLLSRLCLVVFLPYLLLPLIYLGHRHQSSPTATAEEPKAGPLANRDVSGP